jgi:hypothetical protein
MKMRAGLPGSLEAGALGILQRKYCSSWLVALLILCGGFAAPAQASIRAWGCLLYASNVDKAFELPPRLAHYGTPLRRSLGYSNYRVIAQHEIAVENRAESLLVSAGDIQVLLTSLAAESDGKYLVELLFAEGAKQIMQAQAKVGQGSPLFIRGPDWRDGQIIIVVMVAA